MTDEHKEKIAESKIGKRRMHNGKRNMMVPADKVADYFKGEWQLGSYRKQKYTKKETNFEPSNTFERLMAQLSKDA
jgi:hypothetical protein